MSFSKKVLNEFSKIHTTQPEKDMDDGASLSPTRFTEFSMVGVLREQVRTIAATVESLSGRRLAYDVLVSRRAHECAHTHACRIRWRTQPPTQRHALLTQIKLLVSIEFIGCIQFSVSMLHLQLAVSIGCDYMVLMSVPDALAVLRRQRERCVQRIDELECAPAAFDESGDDSEDEPELQVDWNAENTGGRASERDQGQIAKRHCRATRTA